MTLGMIDGIERWKGVYIDERENKENKDTGQFNIRYAIFNIPNHQSNVLLSVTFCHLFPTRHLLLAMNEHENENGFDRPPMSQFNHSPLFPIPSSLFPLPSSLTFPSSSALSPSPSHSCLSIAQQSPPAYPVPRAPYIEYRQTSFRSKHGEWDRL